MKLKTAKGWILPCEFSELLTPDTNEIGVWAEGFYWRKSDVTDECVCEKECKPVRITISARIE